MIDIPNFIGRHILRFDNHRVVSPPGPILPGEGPFILVASVMRSGTHLLIDTILNNFPRTRWYPLYVELGGYLHQGRIPELLSSGGYVVKTHFPQVDDRPEWIRSVEAVARRSRILITYRDQKETYRSTRGWLEAEPEVVGKTMSLAESEDVYYESLRRFEDFWGQFEALRISYHDLIDRRRQPELIREIGAWIGQEPRSPMIRPYPKTAKVRPYAAKALTRLIGRHAPVINTTIRFAKHHPPQRGAGISRDVPVGDDRVLAPEVRAAGTAP